MHPEGSLNALTLTGLAHRCAQETERFFGRSDYDPLPCFELFRRALVERDQAAYELLYLQYRALVTSWVERHPGFPALDEEAQYFVNRAFEKLWRAVPPEKFQRFPNLKSLLSYLKTCTASVIIDFARAPKPPVVDEEPGDFPVTSQTAGANPEEYAVAQMQQQELWQFIEARLNDDKERAVLYGVFVLGLKPRDLCLSSPAVFADVTEVYRTKQNLMERLRRDKDLRQLVGNPA